MAVRLPHRGLALTVAVLVVLGLVTFLDGGTTLGRGEAAAVSSQMNAAQPGPESNDDIETRIRYSRTKLAFNLVEQFWSWLVLLGILGTGLSARMRDWARRMAKGRWRTIAAYVIAFGLFTSLLALPLSFYDGYVVEHQFGLSRQSVLGWLSDRLLEAALGLAIALPLVVALYWLIERSPRRWWLAAAGILIALSVVLAALFPVLIAPLFNTYQPIEDSVLERRLVALADRAGVRVADVVKMDMSRRTEKANAYFAGIGPTRRIVLADTLIEQFTHDEIETVVAHELGHQVHDDIWRGLVVGAAFYLAATYALFRSLSLIIRRFGTQLGFGRVGDVASLPLLALLFSLLAFVAMPALNTYSRMVEHEADRYALEVTGAGETYASALAKLGKINLADPDPPGIIEFVFYSHPPIDERIAFAQSFDQQRAP